MGKRDRRRWREIELATKIRQGKVIVTSWNRRTTEYFEPSDGILWISKGSSIQKQGWERVYDDSHHIVYAKRIDRDELRSVIESVERIRDLHAE